MVGLRSKEFILSAASLNQPVGGVSVWIAALFDWRISELEWSALQKALQLTPPCGLLIDYFKRSRAAPQSQ
jgi:hypothetical protein